jgi:hypothetical protein
VIAPLNLLFTGTRGRSFLAIDMPPATAEKLLKDLSTQLEMLIHLPMVDLTSAILKEGLIEGETRRPIELDKWWEIG